MYVDGTKRQWSMAEIEAYGRDDIEELRRLEGGVSAHVEDQVAPPSESWQEQWRKDVAEKQAKDYEALTGRKPK